MTTVVPLKGCTKACDFVEGVIATLNQPSLNLSYLLGVTSDGAPAVVGRQGVSQVNAGRDSEIQV